MRLNELFDAYADRVHFYMIYIREAHPDDGWQVPNNLIENILFDDPRTVEERADVASTCILDLGIRMPALLDAVDNDVEEKYVGLPMRQFLIDDEGKVVYAGAKGPFGWDDDAFEASLKSLLQD